MKKHILIILAFMCLFILAACTGNFEKASMGIREYELIKADPKWEDLLVSTLTELYNQGEFDGREYAVALFDVDLDGLPELVDASAGGSSGGVLFNAYDIRSGKAVGRFSGGVFRGEHSDAWCVYFDADAKAFKNIGCYTTRGGNDITKRQISQLVENSDIYSDKSLFFTEFLTDESNDNVTAKHYVLNKEASPSEYAYQFDIFTASNIRIHETGMKLVRWNDIPNNDNPKKAIPNMAEALLKSEQMFVNITQ